MEKNTVPDGALIMQVLETAGRTIMEYGGETFRAEDTILYMGHAMGVENVECFAVPSGVFISCTMPDGLVETGVVRVRRKGTNLSMVDEVNRISRSMQDGTLDAASAACQLKKIAAHPICVDEWKQVAAAGVTSGAFAVMFGGGLPEFVLATLTGSTVRWFLGLLEKKGLGGGFVSALIGSFLSALVPLLVHYFTGFCLVEPTIAGELMPLLPGLAMTNGVQDTLRGDYVSGVSHTMQAITVAGLVAGGALLAANLLGRLGGSL